MSYVSRKELYDAYLECIKRKRNTNNAINFEVDDSINLNSLYKELNTMTYEIGKSIIFVLRDEHGIPKREVAAADFRDRVVHHLICKRVWPIFEENLIDDNYACRKEKGTLYAVQQCHSKLKTIVAKNPDKQVYCFKGDFKNCFNSLNKNVMWDYIENYLRNSAMKNDKNLEFNLWLLKKILMHCPQNSGNFILKGNIQDWDEIVPEKSLFNLDDFHGLAIGNLTSQTFTNFFMGQFDLFVTKELGYQYYGRYVDDFYIFFTDKEKFMEDYKKMCQFANDVMDMNISKSKFYLQEYKKGIVFLGHVIYKNRMYVTNKTVGKFYKIAHEMNTILQYRNNGVVTMTLTTGLRIQPTWNSYAAILNQVNGHNIIKKVKRKYPYLIACISSMFYFDEFGYMHLLESYKEYLEKEKMKQ